MPEETETCESDTPNKKLTNLEKLYNRQARLKKELSETSKAINILEDNPDTSDLFDLLKRTVGRY